MAPLFLLFMGAFTIFLLYNKIKSPKSRAYLCDGADYRN